MSDQIKTNPNDPWNTNYAPGFFQCWSNGQKSCDGHDKAQTLFWCWVGEGYKSERLGFDTAAERDAFALEHGGTVCAPPSSGDRDFSVRKNKGPYTAAISF